MGFKEKIIGILLILVGALPFLLKLQSINNAIGKYTWLLPGQGIYQTIVIILGLFLLIKIKRKSELQAPQRGK